MPDIPVTPPAEDTPELTPEQKSQALHAVFNRMELDPSSVQTTLGAPHRNVTQDTILDASHKVLKIARLEADTDDRDSLEFQTTHDASDFLADKVRMDQNKVLRNALWRVTHRGNLDRVPTALLDAHVNHLFQSSGLSNALEECNSLDQYDNAYKLTRMGEGALPSIDSVPKEARSVSPSYLGFVDPIRSPECHTEGTEVMTSEGWVDWSKTSAQTEFLCLIDGVPTYCPALSWVGEQYSGIIYRCMSPVTLSVTPTHRMWLNSLRYSERQRDIIMQEIRDAMTREFYVCCDPEGPLKSGACFVPLNASKWEIAQYTGFVYCAQVPGSLLFTRCGGETGVWTGNSLKVGVDLNIASGVRKGPDNQLYRQFRNVKTGKLEWLSQRKAAQSTIVFPGVLEQTNDKYVPAMTKGGGISYKTRDEVQYELVSGDDMFSDLANITPLKSGVKGMRLNMGARFAKASLPIVGREAPYVQGAAPDGTPMMKYLAKAGAAVFADKPGTVTSVSHDKIIIKNADGTTDEKELFYHFPHARKTFVHNYAEVKPGDMVKPGDLLASSNFTDKKGELALTTNLRVAYTPAMGKTFEDSFVLSESAAKKLTSTGMYNEDYEPGENTVLSKQKFRELFPGKLTPDQLKTLQDDGTVKPGTLLKSGDPIYIGVRTLPPSPETMGRTTVKMELRTWDHDEPGIVTDVSQSGKSLSTLIRANSQMQVGDKIGLQFGGKGVAAEIIPDEKMPRDSQGRPIELLLSPLGIVSRTNAAQVAVAALGKVAEKTGKRYVLPGFSDEDIMKLAQRELDKAGMTDREDIYDPELGRTIPKVMVGNLAVYKQQHMAEGKGKSRSVAGYTADLEPAKGGPTGSKHIGDMEYGALQSHGAEDVIKDLKLVKGQRNDSYWRQLKLGQTPAMPGTPFVYEKFNNLLRAAGIQLTEDKNTSHIFGMTDKQVQDLTSNRKLTSSATYGATSFRPLQGGLFDPDMTGSMGDGKRWSYFEAPEPMLNPVMEDSVRSLLGMTKKELTAVVSGETDVDGKKGGAALQTLLSRLDLPGVIQESRQMIRTGARSKRDAAIKQLSFASALLKQGIKPEELMWTRVPVLPPAFRPITKTDKRFMVADPNYLYKTLHESMQDFKDSEGLPDVVRQKARLDMYNNLKSLVGVADPTQEKLQQKNVGGIIEQALGKGSPKGGFFQRRVIGTNIDLSGLGVATLNPALKLNQIGLPEAEAWDLYEPFILRKMVQSGYPAAQASMAVKKRDAAAYRALQTVVKERPVTINRAPTLHRYSIIGMNPVLVKGHTIQVPPGIHAPLGLDHDGDNCYGQVLVKLSPDAKLLMEREKGISFLEQRKHMFTKTKMIGKKDGEAYLFDLSEFPHGDLQGTKQGEKGPIEFYDVPKGVEVLAYDEATSTLTWAPVTSWSKHLDREVEIVNLDSGYQVFTDDDPRAVYGIGSEDMTPVRATPTDAMSRKLVVPRQRTFKPDVTIRSLHTDTYLERDGASPKRLVMKKEVQLDEAFGYMIGALAGDGWAAYSHDKLRNQVSLSGTDEGVFKKTDEAVCSLFEGPAPEMGRYEFTKSMGGRHGDCSRVTWSSKDLSSLVSELIGRGADNKHLPPFYLTAPEECRLGMFAGLMDTDGSICVCHSKKKPQLSSSFTTTSFRLAYEVRWLAASLGISSRVTRFTYRGENTAWNLYFSNGDLKRWGGKGMMVARKVTPLAETEVNETAPSGARTDRVPFPKSICREAGEWVKSFSVSQSGLYTAIRDASAENSLTRLQANKLVAQFRDRMTSPEWKKWLTVLDRKEITWEVINSVEKTGAKETGYDLTVPGYETFTTHEGIVLSNTLSYSVPVSQEAVREVREKMMADKLLLSVKNDKPLFVPQQEYLMGMHFMHKNPASEPMKRFATSADAVKAYRKGEINVDTPVRIGQ